MKKEIFEKLNNPKYLLPIIIILAAIVRIIFFMGHVFSDDSYYSQLAISFLEGRYPQGYIGYPIDLARKLITAITAAGFMVFGKNEIGSIAFPFLFSLLSIGLIYAITKEIFDKKTALISAFILAIFPIDIIFATLNFSDLIAAFFINFGIYYIIRYLKYNESKDSFFAGIYFAVSIFGKMNFYYVGILLIILLLYRLKTTHKIDQGILVSLMVPTMLLFFEALIYGSKTGDYLYRLHLVEQNYKYSYYDFFPYTANAGDVTGFKYFLGVLHQIFVENLKDIFLRRFYLFIPLIALVQSVLLILSRKSKGIVFWFLGIVTLYAAMTTSLSNYRPLNLTFSWHLYPIFFPSIILAASFIKRFSFKISSIFFVVLFITSMVMTNAYQNYFELESKNEFKKFIRENDSEIIYTDHHTKYGIDLIDGYPETRRTKSVTNLNIPLSNIPITSFVIYNPDEINELMKQGHRFKFFSELYSGKFKLIDVIAGYEIYRKVE